MSSYFQTVKIFVRLYKLRMKHIMTPSVKFLMPIIHSIAFYRNSRLIMIYFKVSNDIKQRNMRCIFLLAMLLAKITVNEHVVIFRANPF
jgi:hypothetical protein